MTGKLGAYEVPDTDARWSAYKADEAAAEQRTARLDAMQNPSFAVPWVVAHVSGASDSTADKIGSGGSLAIGLAGIAATARLSNAAGSELGGAERVPNEADPALKAEIDRIGQEGHALDRHGEGVTNDQLYTRPTTGVAPDGSSVVRKGQVVIPPTSSAFNSNELLAQSDLYIRQNYLERAVALSPPGASQVAIEGVDMGSVVGRGFDRVSATPGAAGPLSFNSQMSRATAAYVYDPASGVWKTITIYPAK